MKLWWAYRALLTLACLAFFAQAMLAGQFLSGSYESLRWHQINATCTDVVLFCSVVVAVFLRWPGKTLWPLLASLGLLVASQLQSAAGAARLVSLHIPLGVAMIVGSVAVMVFAWRAVAS